MKSCSNCKHREQVNGWMDVCRNGLIAGHIVSPEKVGCADHETSEEVEKKKVLIRLSLSRNGSHYWIDKPATEGISSNNVHFVRWLTPEDMKKIMNGEEIEI